jgi:exosortase A
MYLKPPSEVVHAPARLEPTILALFALPFLALFGLYFGTAQSIVHIWNSSETFAHGYIILPISLWLIWRRRGNFVVTPPTPYWAALAWLALAGCGWMVAQVSQVQVVQQYMFAAMLPLAALALFGRRLAGSLAFPLIFVLAAVPFGEIFIGPLISFTADFTVRALQLTGIPVLRTGTHFEIPTGSWSVVEACSGVRYLISSVTLGLLYAYLTYRSTARRVLFMAVAVIVPIIANGIRAYMIVMIGHLSSMKLAVGVDHIIYGWLFFGLVMFLMFWIGNFWREDDRVRDHAAGVATLADSPEPTRRTRTQAVLSITLAIVLVAALWPALAAYNRHFTFNPRPVQLAPVASSWSGAPAFSQWTPSYMAPDAQFTGVYAAPVQPAEPVAMTILYYRNQEKNKSLISSVNVPAAENTAFSQVSTGLRTEQIGGSPFTVRETRLVGPDGPMLVWHWMWVDQRATANDYLGKVLQARAKLLFRSDDGAAVLLSAPFSENPEVARRALRAFLDTHAASLDAALTATRNR